MLAAYALPLGLYKETCKICSEDKFRMDFVMIRGKCTGRCKKCVNDQAQARKPKTLDSYDGAGPSYKKRKPQRFHF